MGILSYMKPKGKKAAKAEHAQAELTEKVGGTSTPGTGAATPFASRPQSLYPSNAEEINEIKCEVKVNWLYQQQMESLWTAGGRDEGVVLKKSRSAYACCPADIMEEPYGFYKAIETLNVRTAMTVNTRVIKLLLHNNDKPYVPLPNGLRLQVLPDMSYLPRCQKHQFAAFIADRGILVVWDDEPRHLVERAREIEKSLMQIIWDDGPQEADEKKEAGSVMVNEVGSEDDVEIGTIEPPRRIVMILPVLSCLTMFCTTLALGAGWARIAQEVYIDQQYIRMALILVYPLQAWLGLFFFQTFVTSLAQLMGPIAQMNENSKYYSGIKPRRLRRDAGPLPHITVQMPVYKEGLTAVIEPTIHSLKAAMSTYEMQGGTANIFCNDDGMQLISEDDARARQDFYDEHNIGWVARPKHNLKPENGDVFNRRGKFKKASNMNYAMWVSVRVEDKLTAIDRHQGWNQDDEAQAYRDALGAVVEEDDGRTWADGNIRMGDYILIIDSDTRVPTDCFLDAASEMEQSPQVAIIQHSSGVMNVTDSFFERGITFFTNLVYTAIRFAVASGDCAPFVGHNAILRWTALQEIAYDADDGDEREKYWSEETVSEDFDMSLRLQNAGYLVRMAAYQGDGYQEGVSLTVYDELARWEKYAYGCSELVFNPFRYWFTRGPFTKLFKKFFMSGMPFPSKLTCMAYIGTYYAIGSSWVFTVMNYFIAGWFNGHLDHYYLDSFKIFFAVILVFTALGNVALATLRYRIGEASLFGAIIENFKWVPLLSLFLGGASLHVSQALASHMLGIDMSWGATSKEAEDTTFFKEVPKIIKNFKFSFIFCIFFSIAMVVLSTVAPPFWKINLFIAVFPLSVCIGSHFLMPIALNPGLMRFTW